MKVYVLTSTYICVDSGDYETWVVGVYKSVEDALKKMQEKIHDARIDFKDYDTEEDDGIEEDMSWSIWEKEQYMSSRCDIFIEECEIE